MFYTPPPLSKKTKIIILLLVLLIHLLLLIPFLNTEFIFLPKSPLEQKVKELHKKVHKLPDDEPEEWAALKSRAMQMSAPVILADSTVAPAVAESFGGHGKAMADRPDADNENTIQEELTDNSDHNNQSKDEPENKSSDQDTHQSIDIPDKSGTHPVTQKQEDKPVEATQPHNKLPVSQAQSKPHAQAPAKLQQKRPTTTPRQQQKQQPQLSLAQLAKGFADHMKNEGMHTLSMAGRSNAKATELQLKELRFLERILGAVQHSWKLNIKSYPLTHPVIVTVNFIIIINKDGSLKNFTFKHSTGHQSIDNYIKSIVQQAGTSFPSIPDYMKKDIYPLYFEFPVRLPGLMPDLILY